MFTINIYLKFALIAFGIISGIILWFTFGFGYAWLPLLLGIILLLSYILLGTVQSASQMVQEGNFEAAEKRLALTYKPSWLYVTNRAFYNIMKGSIAASRNDSKTAEVYFNEALEMKLPSDNEKAMVLMQLTSINANKNKWAAAKNYYNQLKKLKITQPQIKEQMQLLDKGMSQQGQVKAAQTRGKQGMQMMSRGGKRRRPKMR